MADVTLDRLFNKWCRIQEGARVVVVTDSAQSALAEAIRRDFGARCTVIHDAKMRDWRSLDTGDLLIALLSIESYIDKGANRYFPAFCKPKGLRAGYAFIRLGISEESLRQGLSTDKARVLDKIDQMSRFASGDTLRVTNAAGTDVTLSIEPFKALAFEFSTPGGGAFLPPSETSAEVIAQSANGKIVIDITAGQLYSYGKLLGMFGRVPDPITLTIENGEIKDIAGADMAAELKHKLFSLPAGCRTLVELGQGLSDMTPTGLIGVDESIITTCHFGFGDASACGTHWDAVISVPDIYRLSDTAMA